MTHTKTFLMLIVTTSLLFPSFVFAQYRFELTPSITAGETYDSNIYLDPDHEKSDYITTVSPGLRLDLVGQHTNLALEYIPTLVMYASNTHYNTVDHLGTITLGHDLSQTLHFDLTDTYLKSEAPIEHIDTIVDVRHTRRSYQRNSGSASVRYTFGPEDTLTVGYRNSLLLNDDETLNDGRIQTPFVASTVWFNVRNGLEFSYDYTDAAFWRKDHGIAEDNYTGHTPGVRYIYRLSPHTRCFVGYTLTTRDFKGATEDYQVHQGIVGYEQAVSSDFSYTLGLGYFKQDIEHASGGEGPVYNASIVKRFYRGSITVGGAGGWHEAYLEANRTGFSKFRSVDASLDYQLLEPLTGYATGYYSHDKADTGRVWETYLTTCGLRWRFYRWYTVGLQYRYSKRRDHVYLDNFTDNRVMLTFSASRLFRL